MDTSSLDLPTPIVPPEDGAVEAAFAQVDQRLGVWSDAAQAAQAALQAQAEQQQGQAQRLIDLAGSLRATLHQARQQASGTASDQRAADPTPDSDD